MKNKLLLLIFLICSISLISGCSNNYGVPVNMTRYDIQDQPTDIVDSNHVINKADKIIAFIDCRHYVVCYNYGLQSNGLTCTYVPPSFLPECN